MQYKQALITIKKSIMNAESGEFEILSTRLNENMNETQLYGDTPETKADRYRILFSLNMYTINKFGKTYNEIIEHPENIKDPNNEPIDLAIYIALSEEFNHVVEILNSQYKSFEYNDISITIFQDKWKERAFNRFYNVFIIPAGTMGNISAGNIITSIMTIYKPQNIVIAGIAGAISADLQIGDVFIPASVNDYLANIKITGKKIPKFEPSGSTLSTDQHLLNNFRHFNSKKYDGYNNWRANINNELNIIINDEMKEALKKLGVNLPLHCKLVVGEDKVLGSGPAVIESRSFANWIKSQNRKVAAVDTESAGVYNAAFMQKYRPSVLTIRGISDCADKNKSLIESATQSKLRKLAMKNVISLIKVAVEEGLFNNQQS